MRRSGRQASLQPGTATKAYSSLAFSIAQCNKPLLRELDWTRNRYIQPIPVSAVKEAGHTRLALSRRG